MEKLEELYRVLRSDAYPLIVEATLPTGQTIWRYIISSPRMAERYPPPIQRINQGRHSGAELKVSTAYGEIYDL